MIDVEAELVKLLDVERLDNDLFRGEGGGGETSMRIFGGQVIAQALMAAYGTVEDRLCHSLHAYFVRPGDPAIPVIYRIDEARDGGSFTTRRVTATQHGKQILNMSASFHSEEESWDHQHDMPDVPGPDGLMTRQERRELDLDKIDKKFRKDFVRVRPIEIKEIEPLAYVNREPVSDNHHVWFRMAGAKGQTVAMHHCLLAYASDMHLLGSSLRPHGLTWFEGNVMTASLDHAMWFHGPILFEDWHLYTMDSPFTGRGRSFNRGAIYTQDGRLAASVAQEGLVRKVRARA